ncbi:DHA2 family efflux MFS transporter permease subunit [Herbiconiux daphne]|uniref:DHA2 family efflux MFS transporter permease subunit n=1 Tax=Herbiconiux daphne TaxID=2970914 RepID=A0ABT2GYL9_9MICO|nr:DHA2 family efflux MFS transporter permease subunit [Herbiconiux daphne]MCS5733050.1 DHA2 family efflux MFS transporter permease subunit [Herbiconiux daphne]
MAITQSVPQTPAGTSGVPGAAKAEGAVGPAPKRRIPIWLAVLAASLPMFMATLDNLVVTSALPVLGEQLSASVEQLQWFVNAYTLSFASLMLFAVALGDRLGRRTVFLWGIGIFTVASALCAVSTEPWMLIAARAVQGAGAAALMPLSLTLLVGSVSARMRPLAIGIWGGISGLGVALGPLIGGAVIQGWNWDAIFWLNVPVGIVTFPLVLLALPNSFGARLRADLVGVLLAGVGVLGVVYGIIRGNDAGWSSLEVLGSIIGGAVLLAAFVLWESRAANPLLPLRLFRDRSFSVANVVGLVFSFGIFGAIFILIQFLQIVQGKTPLEAGILTMPWTLAPMVIAPLAGFIVPRVGTRLLIVVGLSLQAIGVGWFAFTMTPDVAYGTLLPAFLFAGVGMGLVFAPSSTAVLVNMSPQDNAKASGTNSTLREIGVALGIAVLTAIFTANGGEFTPTGYVDAAIPAIWVGAAALLLAALTALLLPAGRSQERH